MSRPKSRYTRARYILGSRDKFTWSRIKASVIPWITARSASNGNGFLSSSPGLWVLEKQSSGRVVVGFADRSAILGSEHDIGEMHHFGIDCHQSLDACLPLPRGAKGHQKGTFLMQDGIREPSAAVGPSDLPAPSNLLR